jgi:transcriptional regulator with XRE-family HTH domain
VGRVVTRFDGGLLRRARLSVRRLDRPRAGLSLDELAARVGAVRALIIDYEAGRKVPGPARLVALAEAVGVRPEALSGVRAERAQLVDLRCWAGLTAEQAAGALGVSRWAYSNWEQRGVIPQGHDPVVFESAAATLFGRPVGTVTAAAERIRAGAPSDPSAGASS